MLPKRRQNVFRAPHHRAAQYNYLGVVCVNESDNSGSPYSQASFADSDRDRIAGAAATKESFEVDSRLARQGGFRISRPSRADLGQRPSGGFRFNAANVSTNAPSPVPDNRQMATQTSTLKVLSTNQPPIHHRRRSYSGSKRHHYDIVESARRTGESFSQQRHTGVILDPKRQAELRAAPMRQIQPAGVGVLAPRR
jgi:hypothetical protein